MGKRKPRQSWEEYWSQKQQEREESQMRDNFVFLQDEKWETKQKAIKQDLDACRKQKLHDGDYFDVSQFADGLWVYVSNFYPYSYVYPMSLLEADEVDQCYLDFCELFGQQDTIYQMILSKNPIFEFDFFRIRTLFPKRETLTNGEICYDKDRYFKTLSNLLPNALTEIRDYEKLLVDSHPKEEIPHRGVVVQSSMTLSYPAYIYPVETKAEGKETVQVIQDWMQNQWNEFKTSMLEIPLEEMIVTIHVYAYENRSFDSSQWFQVIHGRKQFQKVLDTLVKDTLKANLYLDAPDSLKKDNSLLQWQKGLQSRFFRLEYQAIPRKWKSYNVREKGQYAKPIASYLFQSAQSFSTLTEEERKKYNYLRNWVNSQPIPEIQNEIQKQKDEQQEDEELSEIERRRKAHGIDNLPF